MYDGEVQQEAFQSLADITLFKAIQPGEDGRWKFHGIASDESPDQDNGDTMLKSIIDVSYASKRGYVNWNHDQEPAGQVGFLSKCSIIQGENELESLAKSFGTDLSPTACVYVAGELYKNVPKAQDVWNIMQSTPEDAPGLGLSLEGGLARMKKTGQLVKAVVRGVAITPRPAHVMTFMQLRKSISDETERLIKATREEGLEFDEAVLFVLKQRPTWNYGLASRVVQYTMQKREGAAQ